jgi:large subunit ribosomal protein L30
MICIIRIKGMIGIKTPIAETLDRLRLRKKYACVVLVKPTAEQLGMVRKVKDFVAYGEISKETFDKLVESRGQLIDKSKKSNFKNIVEELEKGKKYEEVNLKSFFRLHPPRGGIDSKKPFGVQKGVLGNNKEKINDLVLRML